MKNLIKIASICSALIVVTLLICSCGGDAENFVQGNGKITVTALSSLGAPLANVKIDVHADSATGALVDTWTTDATGVHDFQKTVGSDYYLTFTDQTTPARFASPYNHPSKVTPLLTSTVSVTVTLPKP